MTSRTVLLCFPDVPPAAQFERLVAMTAGVADVVHCPYHESSEARIAPGRGDLAGVEALTGPPLTPEQRDAFRNAEVILSFDLPLGLGSLAERLRWVQGIGTGTEHYFGAHLPEDVVVTNASGVASASIAEFVFARLLAIRKQVAELANLQRRHTWDARYGQTLARSTIGIVGFGAIGKAVAQRAKGFDMEVLAVRGTPAPDPLADEVHPPGSLLDVLPRCDVVVVAAPATAETEDMFDRASLESMRPGAILCNVARGSLVDEGALVDALRSGHLGAAILDVVRQEPLPPTSPLWDVPNLYVSAHCASSLDTYFADVYELLIENLDRYLRHEPLINRIGPGEAPYR